MSFKTYSNIAMAIDLIMDYYETDNAIIIEEKCMEDLQLDLSIHQIYNYLNMNKKNFKENEFMKKIYTKT